jgi:hypothetical protein
LEFELAYKTRQEREFFPYGGQHVQVSLEVPAGEWTLPPFVADKPVYTTLKFGDRNHLVVLDKGKKDDPFYTRLYFDANANNDLTDDSVHRGTYHGDDHMHRTEFHEISTTIVVDGEELPYVLQPQLYCYAFGQSKDVLAQENWNNFQFYTSTLCAYRGELKLGKETYTVWVSDSNGNGRFDDRCVLHEHSGPQLYGQGDGLYLAASSETMGYEYGQTLGEYLVVGGRVFRVAVSTPLGRMTLEPVTENLSKLVWPDQLEALEVYDAASKSAVILRREGKQAPIPAGTYRLLNYRLTKKDKQGDLWQLRAIGTTSGPEVLAKPDHVAQLPLGEPFQPKVTIPDYSRQNIAHGADAQLSLDVYGAGGEQITDLRHIDGNKTKIKLSRDDNQRPAEPVYKIINADGEMVATGKFEYG